MGTLSAPAEHHHFRLESSPDLLCAGSFHALSLEGRTRLPGCAPCAGVDPRRRFQCGQCSFSTAYKCSLIVHQRTHTGERPFQCRLCARTFAHKCNLKSHLRVHSGERPFRCPLCVHCFSQRSALSAHLQTHHQGGATTPPHTRGTLSAHPVQLVQPPACALCISLVGRPEELRVHMMTDHAAP
ncbi:uncharacterized protein LOC144159789 [Haemaphysalis longicornis]